MNEIQKAFLNGERVKNLNRKGTKHKYFVFDDDYFIFSNIGVVKDISLESLLVDMDYNESSWIILEHPHFNTTKLKKLEFDSTDPALPQIRDKINEIIDILNEVRK